jgi:hypothetical protein
MPVADVLARGGPTLGLVAVPVAALGWRLLSSPCAGHTRARLLHFLEDARQRDVLRTVGPIYQFRHARRRDRLAGRAMPE